MNRLKHIFMMIFGMILYYLVTPLFSINSYIFKKSLPYIGYYAFIPRDENKWHELPYGAGGKERINKK